MVTGNAIFIFCLIFLAVSLMTLAYIFRRPALALGSAIIWLIFGLFNYTLSTATWDIYYGLFWFAVGMVFVSMLEGFVLRPKENQQETMEDYWRDEYWANEQERYINRRREFAQYMSNYSGVRGYLEPPKRKQLPPPPSGEFIEGSYRRID